MILSDSGAITIRTYSASEAEPIKGATVRIKGAEEMNRFVFHSLLTDRDGVTETVRLPAPQRSYSLSPFAAEKPYSVYDIEVTKDGFYPKRLLNVAIFAGVDALLPVNMIPSNENGADTVYPQGNINAVITENNRLE